MITLFSTKTGDSDLSSARQRLLNEIDCSKHNIITWSFDLDRTYPYAYGVEWSLTDIFNEKGLFKNYDITDIIVDVQDIRIIGMSKHKNAWVHARILDDNGQEYFNRLTADLRIPKTGITIDRWFFAPDLHTHHFCSGQEEMFFEHLFDLYTENLEDGCKHETF